MVVYLNGTYVEQEKACISVWDHGLLYGDGVFEGIRAYNGKIFKLREHLVRMYKSAHSLQIKMEMPIEEMEKVILQTCSQNGLKDYYIRVIISRGTGDLGIDPRKCKSSPTVIVIADKITLYPEHMYETGLTIITASTQKLPAAVFSAQIKSLNYLPNIKAKIEAINAGADEALMLTSEGYATECTTENIFIVNGNTLSTPPIHLGLLEGVTRNTVMELAKNEGIEVCEKIFTTHDIYTADECFVTGTGAELLPVRIIDGRAIGDGKPGPVTKKLLNIYRKFVSENGTPF